MDSETGATADVGEAAPQKHRLLCVARTSDSPNLIVCINNYDDKAFGRPDLPFATKLGAFRRLSTYDAHCLWFAEEASSWYLEHQQQMLDILIAYIVENRIRSVKLLGSSAGGYAALRTGLLIDRLIAGRALDVVVLSFAINPQTGFRPELIARIRQAVSEEKWNMQDVGRNPVLLTDDYRHHYRHLAIDVVDLAAIAPPTNFAAIVLSDQLNPIEKTFSADLAALEFVLQLPQDIGMNHAAGCTRILQSDQFWETFNTAVPYDLVEPTDQDLRLLS